MGRFKGRVSVGDRIYSLYNIKIMTSMDSPHKTWKSLRVCVCVISFTVRPHMCSDNDAK